MSTNVHQMSKLGHFLRGKWIMDYGILRLRQTLKDWAVSPNNLVLNCSKLSAPDVTEKAI